MYRESPEYQGESGRSFQGTLVFLSFFNISFFKAKTEKVQVFL